MKASGFAFEKVKAVSGSGQQHGSVYWKQGGQDMLASVEAGKPLAPQLDGAFSIPNGPIWMDSSTGPQCRALEGRLGGPINVATLTGSRAYERFTGNQIAKIAVEQPEAYASTERISLVSSLMPSLLKGSYASIDHSDAGGMNLMDIKEKKWAQEAIEATAEGLESKLGSLVASHSPVGVISSYFVSTYGFEPSCSLIAWSGDNPNSVAGLGLKEGDVAISMGTSDTLFGITGTPTPATEGHVFVNCVDPRESYMVMLCFKNGSLNRERVRDAFTPAKDWDEFNALLSQTPPGNSGNIGIYVAESEITPNLPKGDFRFNQNGETVGSFEPAVEARALVEGMALSMRLHAASIGITNPKRIIATGGASANTAVLEVISDVFGLPVYTHDSTDSASLGAAIRALHGYHSAAVGEYVPFSEIYDADISLTVEPKADTDVYTNMLRDYQAAEDKVLA